MASCTMNDEPLSAPRHAGGKITMKRTLLVLAGLGGGLCSAGPAQAGFSDVSAPSGISKTDMTYGLGWADFDGDERLDLLVARHFFPPLVYRGLANGS